MRLVNFIDAWLAHLSRAFGYDVIQIVLESIFHPGMQLICACKCIPADAEAAPKVLGPLLPRIGKVLLESRKGAALQPLHGSCLRAVLLALQQDGAQPLEHSRVWQCGCACFHSRGTCVCAQPGICSVCQVLSRVVPLGLSRVAPLSSHAGSAKQGCRSRRQIITASPATVPRPPIPGRMTPGTASPRRTAPEPRRSARAASSVRRPARPPAPARRHVRPCALAGSRSAGREADTGRLLCPRL